MVDKETNPLKAIKNDELRSRTPDFLQKNSGFLNKVKGQNRGEAASALGEAEKSASSSASSVDVQNGANRGGLYAGKGLAGQAGKKSKSKMRIAKGPSLAIIGLVLVAMIVIIPSIPFIAIGAIDHNLQDALGFSGTGAILEKIAAYIISEKTAKGEVPAKLANDFADKGIIFGQLTSSGDFIRTNKYLANIDNTSEVAATGFDYFEHGTEGELSVLYNGEVIDAKDLVSVIESDPGLYADYSAALDIKARFYYSDEVAEVYDELGLNRAAFFDWAVTGDNEEDEKNYYETIDEILKDDVSATMAGCEEGVGDDCDSTKLTATSVENNEELERTAGNTERAAQLLNMAISSTEPQKAARAFLAIEEPIQRARIDGEGPINQVMNSLNRQIDISYIDVNTNKSVVEKKSILETTNFAAAISNGSYSKNEANNFSRDRVLIATGTVSNDGVGGIIKGSTLGDDNISSPKAVLSRGTGGVNSETISKANDSVRMATADFNNEMFTSIVGGNRAVEGGSYLSNRINQQVLGAMPSDSNSISKYQKEVDEALARKANSERMTLNPFDISSSNTFLGSIVNHAAIAYLSHSSSGDSGIVSAVSAIADLANDSTRNLLGSAIADGNDRKYATIAGDCTTVSEAANVEGDLYCNSHNTISTKYIDYTKEKWISALGSDVSDSGEPKNNLSKFILFGSGREATVGVKSASICEVHKEAESEGEGFFSRQLSKLKNLANGFLSFIGLYEECDGVPPELATGAMYTLSDSNANKEKVELFSGYMLYDQANALVEESKSEVSKFREKYYAKHPKDNSVAGRIARYSGMTKAEAEIAIGYASYLAKLRNYDPSQRYAFNKIDLNIETPPLIVDDTEIKETIYCYWQSKIEFSDLRNRNQVA